MRFILTSLILHSVLTLSAFADYCTKDPRSAGIYCAKRVELSGNEVTIIAPYLVIEQQDDQTDLWYLSGEESKKLYFMFKKRDCDLICDKMNFGKLIKKSLQLKQKFTTITDRAGYIMEGRYKVIDRIKCQF